MLDTGLGFSRTVPFGMMPERLDLWAQWPLQAWGQNRTALSQAPCQARGDVGVTWVCCHPTNESPVTSGICAHPLGGAFLGAAAAEFVRMAVFGNGGSPTESPAGLLRRGL